MDTNTLIIGGLIAMAVIAVLFLTLSGDDNTRAKKRVAGMSGPGKGRVGKGAEDTSGKDRRKKLEESLSKLDARQKENKKKAKVSMEQRLEQAGMTISVQQFYIGSVICAIVLGAIGVISGQDPKVSAGMLVVGGLGLPRWFVGMAKGRRQKKFITEFSNAIDVIVRGVKSGLPVNECLKIIARESPSPVNEEFHLLTESIRVGLSLDQGLERMYERMPVQEVNFFGIVLMIQQKTGGNLAEALGNLANVLRGRKMMEGKIKALSAEAKASAMIIGALPFIVAVMVHLSAPEYLAPLFTTTNGNFILLGAGTWMAIGIFIMKNMISIKV
ncbi:MAG: type II secretion system F family protein [Pseudomonadota bacterium]